MIRQRIVNGEREIYWKISIIALMLINSEEIPNQPLYVNSMHNLIKLFPIDEQEGGQILTK